MAKHTSLPSQVFDHAPTQAVSHLPTELPPVTTGPTAADVTLPQQALDAVEEHVPPLGVAHLPDFFGLG
jgi:hypothetical protein